MKCALIIILITLVFILYILIEEFKSNEESKKCQMIYINLLENYDKKTQSYIIYLEWKETVRCDNYYSLKEMRNDIEKHTKISQLQQ